MPKRQLDAVYENGVLKPLEPVNLVEGQRVSLVIYAAEVKKDEDEQDEETESDFRPFVAEEGDPNITWGEVHEATKSIPGSFSDDIIRDREDRC